MLTLIITITAALAQIDGGSAGCVTLDLETNGHVVGQVLVIEDGAPGPVGYTDGLVYWAWDAGQAWPARFSAVDNGAGCVAVQTTERAQHGEFSAHAETLPPLGSAFEVTDQNRAAAWFDSTTHAWWRQTAGSLLRGDLTFTAATPPARTAGYPLETP